MCICVCVALWETEAEVSEREELLWWLTLFLSLCLSHLDWTSQPISFDNGVSKGLTHDRVSWGKPFLMTNKLSPWLSNSLFLGGVVFFLGLKSKNSFLSKSMPYVKMPYWCSIMSAALGSCTTAKVPMRGLYISFFLSLCLCSSLSIPRQLQFYLFISFQIHDGIMNTWSKNPLSLTVWFESKDTDGMNINAKWVDLLWMCHPSIRGTVLRKGEAAACFPNAFIFCALIGEGQIVWRPSWTKCEVVSHYARAIIFETFRGA